jgi:DNA-binding transcriptional LysR family regulator
VAASPQLLARLRSLDLNRLVALEVLLSAPSVTEAARRLGTSQPAASRLLAELRALFGDPLLVRAGGRMTLTARAAGLRGAVGEWLAATERLLAPVDFDPSRAAGTLSLIAEDYFVSVFLPRVLARLRRTAPRVDVHIVAQTPGAAAGLIDGAADLLVTPWTEQLPQGLRRRQLYEERGALLLRRGHPALPVRTLKDWARLDHVVLDQGGHRTSWVDARLGEQGLSRRVAVRLPTFAVIPQLVAATDLVAAIPARLAHQAARHLPLVVLDVPEPLDSPRFSFSLVWHERTHHTPLQAWVRQQLVEAVAEVASE